MWRELKWKQHVGNSEKSQRAANDYHRARRNADEHTAPCKQQQPASNSSKQKVKEAIGEQTTGKKNRPAINKQLGVRTEQRETICDCRIVAIEEGTTIS